VALGWLIVLERDTRLQARAAATSRAGASPAALKVAARDLRAARLLNPDSTPDVALAAVERATGDDRRAMETIESVLRREPDNLTAWAILRAFAARSDPAGVERALAARRRLDPLSARRSR
jgi:hypothetical protein